MSVEIPYNRPISDYLSGFWVDKFIEITFLQDAKYFIPPSQIMYIEKAYKE